MPDTKDPAETLMTDAADETPAPASVGVAAQRVAHYDLRREIGRGAMSIVYEARDTQTGQDIALKLLTLPASLNSEQARNLTARFERGVRTLARFTHPNVVSIREIGVYQGRYYLAMEYLRGQTLRERLSGGILPPTEACLILAQIAAALDAAHKAGIVHRDIKPTNIMLLANGTVKLLDFGIAQSSDETILTDAGIIVGSPSCMAPEQVKGQPETPAADIWALGVLCCEMIAGRLPFTGQTVESVLSQILYHSPAPTPNLSTAVQNVLHRALDKRPAQRYSTASALVQALKSALIEPVAAVFQAAVSQAAVPKPVVPEPVASEPVASEPVASEPTAHKPETSAAPHVKPFALYPFSAPRWLPGAALLLLFLLGFCGAFLKWHQTPDAVQTEAVGQIAPETVPPPAFQVSLSSVPSPPSAAVSFRRPEVQIAPHRHQTARVNDSARIQLRKQTALQVPPIMQANLESVPPKSVSFTPVPIRLHRSAATHKQTVAKLIPAQPISAQSADRHAPARRGTQAVVLVKAVAPQLLIQSALPQVPAPGVAHHASAQSSDHAEPVQSTVQGFALPSESSGYDPETDARLRKSAWSQSGSANSP